MNRKLLEKDWVIEPLNGKYYGTRITLPDDNSITVWTPNHYLDQFASAREVANGWTSDDGHDHVEDVQTLEVARLIVAAPKMLRVLERIQDGFISSADQNSIKYLLDFMRNGIDEI